MLQCILSDGSEIPWHYDNLAVNFHVISVISYDKVKLTNSAVISNSQLSY
jgi:hypothetical protein